LAEGILKSKLNTDFYIVDSAGTSAYHIGELPDHRSIAIAKKNGIDISNQRARKFIANDFNEFDLIYAMDIENYHNICSLSTNKSNLLKVKLILNEINPLKDLSVPDPYYGGDYGFENVYEMLDKACSIITKNIS
jgi:protein-tyrosine phosphatase